MKATKWVFFTNNKVFYMIPQFTIKIVQFGRIGKVRPLVGYGGEHLFPFSPLDDFGASTSLLGPIQIPGYATGHDRLPLARILNPPL